MVLLNESVRLSGKQSLFDINIISENFYRDLLGIIEDDELANGNFFEQNNAVFDLYSDKTRKCYQVTSRNDKAKIDDTIDSFNNTEKKLYNNYDLHFIIIGKKVNNQKIVKSINGTLFDTRKIIDSDDILTKIKNCSIEKKKEIFDFYRKYFDNQLINLDINFFRNILEENIENLGERYNKLINILTPLNDSLSTYFVNSNDKYKWLNSSKFSIEKLILKGVSLNTYNDDFIIFNKEVRNNVFSNIIIYLNNVIKKTDVLLESLDSKDDKNYYTINELNKQKDILLGIINNFSVANKSLFVLKGKAGMGKTHTVTYFVKNEIEEYNKYSLLILGQHINQRSSIDSQIINNLNLNMTFDELLFALNEYGYKKDCTASIVIDGINEGLESYNWRNYINGIVQKISRYNFVKVLISIRSEYVDSCLPDELFNNDLVYTKEHQGFKENFTTIMTQVFDCYDLTMPVFPIIDHNFSNPLFVFTFCKMVKKLNKPLIIKKYDDFTQVYIDYINLVSTKLSALFHYEKDDEILQNIIKTFINFILENKTNYIYKKDLLKIITDSTNGYGIVANDYLIAMKSEGLIYKDYAYVKNGEKDDAYADVIRFSFERYEKILTATYLLDKYNDVETLESDINNENNIGEYFSTSRYNIDFGLIQELFIIIQNRFKTEIYDIIDFSGTEGYFQARLS